MKLFSPFLFFCFALSSVLHSQENDPFSEDEDLCVFEQVNVITGHLNFCRQDAEVRSASPLRITRSYTSSGALERTLENTDLHLRSIRGGCLIQGGWSLFPHADLLISPCHKRHGHHKAAHAYLAEPNGQMVVYDFEQEGDHGAYILKPRKNKSSLLNRLSGKDNPGNNRLVIHQTHGKATLYLPDGGKRYYKGEHIFDCHLKFWRLVREDLSNQQRVEYRYNKKDRLVEIVKMSPDGSKVLSSLQIEYLSAKTPYDLKIYTSDLREIEYQFAEIADRDYLEKFISSEAPLEKYGYVKDRKGIGARICNIFLSNQEQLRVSYLVPPNSHKANKWLHHPEKKDFWIDRVEKIERLVGETFHTVARFSYGEDCTDVRDSQGVLRRYHYRDDRLEKIEYFDEKEQLQSSLLIVWNEDYLRAKIRCDAAGRPLFSKTFELDNAGNVLKEVLYGNLTGTVDPSSFKLGADGTIEGAESCFRSYTYKGNLLVQEEEQSGLVYLYQYKPDTDLMTLRCTAYQNKTLKREEFIYDKDGLLVAEIVEDSQSHEQLATHYNRDPHHGMIQEMTRTYSENGQDHLIHKIALTYNSKQQIVEEAYFDCEGSHRYTLYLEYDKHGNLISKSTPLGHQNRYQYDENDRLVQAHEAGDLRKIYSYDRSGRLIACEEEGKTSHFQYDLKNRLIALTDREGNTTRKTYDAFGRCLDTHLPELTDEEERIYTPTVHMEYDTVGNAISTCDPAGVETKSSYTTLGKPYEIRRGLSTTRSIYNSDGSLAHVIHPSGTQEEFFYDPFQRPVLKIIRSSDGNQLAEERWNYSTFHLLSHTDPTGVTTTYTYNGAGQLVRETTADRKTSYFYDSLGFLERTVRGETVYVQRHDVEGNVIDQWEQRGQIENAMAFTYDQENRKQKAERKTSCGWATDHFTYDKESRLVSHTDPLGAVTQIAYDKDCKTTTDPLGCVTVEYYDSAEKIVATLRCDAKGTSLSEERLLYDRSGNLARRLTLAYLDGKIRTTHESRWRYDIDRHVTEDWEGEDRVTRHEYDLNGNRILTTLSSGVSLTFRYDDLGRLIERRSSDNTVWDQYNYDKGLNPTYLYDKIHDIEIHRTYNDFGQLIEERTGDNLQRWDYDIEGHCICHMLPDRSNIEYFYEQSHLKTVRYGTYEHHYTHFDANGHVATEKLGKMGEIETGHDLLERVSKQRSSWMQWSVSYDLLSRVIQTENSLLGDRRYSYDSLSQLTQENDKTYHFDSLGNPAAAHIDAHNQILSNDKGVQIAYDPNGNPLSRQTQEQSYTYTYDALGRLTSITDTKGHQTTYCYDPDSRLFSKTSNGKTFYFLYDQGHEIGLIDEQGKIIELKVLGLGIKGDVGAAILIKLQEQAFIPLHDLAGHIVALINSSGQLEETYSMTAFGLSSTDSPICPWRFSSKRHEGALIFFGCRFYDPSLGRWLTPDPAGFLEGANLYLYVLNNPTNRLDLFGLESDNFFPPPFQRPLSLQAPIHLFYPIPPSPGTIMNFKGFSDGIKTNWFVSCDHWYRLQFTEEEKRAGTFDLMNHLKELVPTKGSCIGLISFQNGIRTSAEELKEMVGSIRELVPEGTLIMGMHNPTRGFFGDFLRLFSEGLNRKTSIIKATRQSLSSLSQGLETVNADLLMLHIAHSEGGLIASQAIKGMNQEQRAHLSKRLNICSLGSVRPISEKYGKSVVNIYSKQDFAALPFAMRHLLRSDCSAQFVSCQSTWKERTGWIIDHAFMGSTYQGALKDHIDLLRLRHKFYEKSNR
jgi:RHS repeat-associated protein